MGTELPETAPGTSRKDDDVDLAAGAIVGEYEIEKQLGQESSAVYAAVHATIERRRVAIKFLRGDLAFTRDARSVTKLRHQNIAEVYGYGATEDGRNHLIMELLDGESLAARLAYDRPSLSQSCRILADTARALEAAHQAGIAHRDLRPENIFLLDNDRVKLLGFGIESAGTPRYSAPEQTRGDTADGRADIYALGVVAYELLVGRPLPGDSVVEPPLPTSVAPGLPATADTLLLAMLAKSPDERPALPRVRELLHAIRAPRAAAAPRAVPVEPPPPRGRRFPMALAATVVLMVGSYAAWRVAAGGEGDLAVPPASIVDPGDTPFESPVEMPSLRSAEKARYQVVEKPVYVEVPVPRPRPGTAVPPPVRPTPPPVIARPATPPAPQVVHKDEARAPVVETPTVLATPPAKTEPPVDDLDALKRPTFKRDRPVP